MVTYRCNYIIVIKTFHIQGLSGLADILLQILWFQYMTLFTILAQYNIHM